MTLEGEAPLEPSACLLSRCQPHLLHTASDLHRMGGLLLTGLASSMVGTGVAVTHHCPLPSASER